MNYIQEEYSDHTYRTEIPNIVFEMGLNPYELSAYCHMKRIAGDKGLCYKTCQKLSEDIGCHRSKFIEVKKSLQEKGLIRITHRKKEDGACTTDVITMIDLWPKNVEYMTNKRKQNVPPVANGDIPPSPMATPPVANGYPKKEHSLRRTTTTKKDVVVPLFIQEIQHVSESDKIELAKFPEDRVRLAIEFNKVEPVLTTKIQQMIWHCQREIPPKPKTKSVKNDLHEKCVEMKKNYNSNHCEIIVKKECIVFIHQGQGEPRQVKFSQENASEEIWKYMKFYKFRENQKK